LHCNLKSLLGEKLQNKSWEMAAVVLMLIDLLTSWQPVLATTFIHNCADLKATLAFYS